MNAFDALWGKAQTIFTITIKPTTHDAVPEYYDDPLWALVFYVQYTNCVRPDTSWFLYYAFAGERAQPLSEKQLFCQFLAALSDVEAWTDEEIIEERELEDVEQARHDIAIMRENAHSFKILVGDAFYEECIQVGHFLSDEYFRMEE